MNVVTHIYHLSNEFTRNLRSLAEVVAYNLDGEMLDRGYTDEESLMDHPFIRNALLIYEHDIEV